MSSCDLTIRLSWRSIPIVKKKKFTFFQFGLPVVITKIQTLTSPEFRGLTGDFSPENINLEISMSYRPVFPISDIIDRRHVFFFFF